ncbi:MAG: cytochrome P450 [Symploca sp. SIO2D2]|nr:cytochrome P450 [Symploca sp. SIO2D2]
MTLPDGPKTPRLWQQIQWITDPISYMETNAQKYGDIFTVGAGFAGETILFVSNPKIIQTVFANPKLFAAPGYLNKILQPLVGENSLFLLEEPKHQDRRKLLYPPFHSKRMQVYGQLICEITKNVTTKLSFNTPFSMRKTMEKITMRVILQVVFGLHRGERYTQLEELLSARINAVSSPLSSILNFFPFLAKDYGSWSPGYRIKLQQQQIDDLLYAEISDRRAEGESDRTDILSLLLSARYENGERMSDEELHDELMTLLFAGHETTATALAWAFYWIHYLPEVKQKLLEEIDSLGENPDPMSLVKLPYLTAVCQETLRIYPGVHLTLPRIVQKNVEIDGKQLENEINIFGCIYLLHQREDLYPQPKQFKPERFLECQFSPYEYMPFGSGIRRCIGAVLAEFEMKLVVTTILKKYQLELADSHPVKPQRRGTFVGPSSGVKMIVKADRTEALEKAQGL